MRHEKNSIVIDCDCGCSKLEIENLREIGDGSDLFTFTVFTRIPQTMGRLRVAWMYLLYGHGPGDEIVLERRDIERMARFLTETANAPIGTTVKD